MMVAGCGQTRLADYWNVNGIDYSDISAAQDRFAIFAEQAVAAPEAEACEALDSLFDKLLEDEVAYFVYVDWIDFAFYSLLSPCRSAALYEKVVERVVSDDIVGNGDCDLYRQRLGWIKNNLEGSTAIVPGVELDGRRTLVLVLNLSCPSCLEAPAAMAADSRWNDFRRVAICCGYGPQPETEGWEFVRPGNVTEVFDPELTPVYFIVSHEGIVETSYTLAI